jgi:hypothetical protein
MSHTPFCRYMDLSHDGLYAFVARAEECPICGSYEYHPAIQPKPVRKDGQLHHPACSVVHTGADAATTPIQPTSGKDVARYVGGLAAIFTGGVLLKLVYDATRARHAPELPSRGRPAVAKSRPSYYVPEESFKLEPLRSSIARAKAR